VKIQTATEDYQLGASGGAASCSELLFDVFKTMLGAASRSARSSLLVVFSLLLFPAVASTQTFTHADTLRGSNGPARAWWDAAFYDLHLKVNPVDSSISGYNAITYRVVKSPPKQEMQIDLQMPLVVDSIVQEGLDLSARRDGNAFFVTLVAPQKVGTTKTVAVYYHGKPTAAVHPPWDGGFVWALDSLGRRWIVTANEGLGASVWWPNKDYLADEPDSQRISITVPDSLIDVSNGRLRGTGLESRIFDAKPIDGNTPAPAPGWATYEWFVANPINNYDVAVNAGHYAHYNDMFEGEDGKLTLDFYPLDYHLDTAKKQFAQVKPMLQCFETWFGPYPWYKDGYKLVETPHLGMEHQSAVAYGNHYKNGYLGRDRSATGHGMKWDFIIIHESAHEWWGNNITMQDQADMWIHESFATYAEGLYTECQQGKKAGEEYTIGQRKLIRNDKPIIAAYGVNAEGSGDMYDKGGNMLLTIRQLVDDDARWRGILRGLNKTFWHQTVTTKQIEDYMSRAAGMNLSKVFDEYLRTTMIPTLEYKLAGQKLSYRWGNVVPGFAMPVKVTTSTGRYAWIRPTERWKSMAVKLGRPEDFSVDSTFYVNAKDVLKPAADSTTTSRTAR